MRILLVEDEAKLGSAVKRGLEQEGYAVDFKSNAEDGLAYAETEDYDVIILDRMLPGGKDGLEICKVLRNQDNNTPILMLTARDAIKDRVQGLGTGADDYLVKPFSFAELVARVKALHRRPQQIVSSIIKIDDITIDTEAKSVATNGKQATLSKKEYSILEYLAFHKGQVISKDKLIQHIWDFDADVLPNTVEVFVRNLRKKLGNDVIETVRGFGYKIK